MGSFIENLENMPGHSLNPKKVGRKPKKQTEIMMVSPDRNTKLCIEFKLEETLAGYGNLLQR